MEFCITQFMAKNEMDSNFVFFFLNRSSRKHFLLCNKIIETWNGSFKNLIKMYLWKKPVIFTSKSRAFGWVNYFFHPAGWCCFIGNFSRNIRFDMDIKIEITIQFIKKAMPCTWIIMRWNWNWNSVVHCNTNEIREEKTNER